MISTNDDDDDDGCFGFSSGFGSGVSGTISLSRSPSLPPRDSLSNARSA